MISHQIVTLSADLKSVDQACFNLALDIDDEHISSQHSEQHNLAVVFILILVSFSRLALGRIKAFSVQHEKPFNASFVFHVIREALQSEVDAAGATTLRCEELSAKRIIHKSALAGGLWSNDGNDNDLFFR